jgi:protein-S-isoprenylcysteine O-methyltransferase Ste14
MLKAGNLFRVVLQHDPRNAIANHQLGLLAFANGDTALAAAHLRSAAEASPTDCEYLNNLGVVLHAHGDFAAARIALEAASFLDDQSPQTFNNLGACLVALGDQASAIRAFRRANTTVNPVHVERASALVTSGRFARTRNPMYVAMALLLAAWAAWLCQPAPLLGPLVFVLFIARFQIIPEERALAAIFGADYAAYKNRVPRWL